MASHFNNPFFLVSVLLLAFPLINFTSARPSENKATNLISDICSKTHNPSLCLQAFRSSPGSANADLHVLGLISIDLARDSASKTLKMIGSLVKQATDPKLKGRYNTCSENYDDAIGNLDGAKMSLNTGDYGSLSSYASAAFDEPGTCEDGFQGPPVEPSQLKHANQKVEDLCSIILVISSRFLGRN